MLLHCTGPFLKFLVCDTPTIEKMPPLSLDSGLGKETYLPRPAGGAVEKNWQLVSPVTPDNLTLANLHPHLICILALDTTIYC